MTSWPETAILRRVGRLGGVMRVSPGGAGCWVFGQFVEARPRPPELALLDELLPDLLAILVRAWMATMPEPRPLLKGRLPDWILRRDGSA